MNVAGMVAETGEATARFLRDIAFGELDQKETLAQQAALGLERLRSVKGEDGLSKDRCSVTSHELVRECTRLRTL